MVQENAKDALQPVSYAGGGHRTEDTEGTEDTVWGGDDGSERCAL
jgi:hypothetical protein